MQQTALSKTEQLENRVNHGITAGIEFGSTGSLIVKDVSQIMEVAKLMAVSRTGVRKHLRDNPGACMAVAMQAFEWGINPFSAANKSYEVNDQIAWESQLLHAVFLRRAPIADRPACTYVGEGAARKCLLQVTTLTGQVISYESPAFGTIKPKNSPLWTSDPDQQLFYYAIRAMCRRHFPDVLLGVYAEDELEALPERNATPRHAATSKPLPPPHLRAPDPEPDPDQQGDSGNGEEWDGERGDETGGQP